MLRTLPSPGDVIRFNGDGRDYQVDSVNTEGWRPVMRVFQAFNQKIRPGSKVWVVRDWVGKFGPIDDMPPFKYIKRNGKWLQRAAS
jgi:hypothetical protein